MCYEIFQILILPVIYSLHTYIDANKNDVSIFSNYDDTNPTHCISLIVSLFVEGDYSSVINEIENTNDKKAQEYEKKVFYSLLDAFQRKLQIKFFHWKIIETSLYDVYSKKLSDSKLIISSNQLHALDKVIYGLIEFSNALSSITDIYEKNGNYFFISRLPSPKHLIFFFDMITMIYMAYLNNGYDNFFKHLIKHKIFANYIILSNENFLAQHILQTDIYDVTNICNYITYLNNIEIHKNLLFVIYVDGIFSFDICAQGNQYIMKFGDLDVIEKTHQAVMDDVIKSKCYKSVCMLKLEQNDIVCNILQNLLQIISKTSFKFLPKEDYSKLKVLYSQEKN
ncbi:hypothetical protein COBT_002357 [Conglomerata obtusa]